MTEKEQLQKDFRRDFKAWLSAHGHTYAKAGEILKQSQFTVRNWCQGTRTPTANSIIGLRMLMKAHNSNSAKAGSGSNGNAPDTTAAS